jgi:NAD(P)-dependent dehydrogenase (short-subunit alcohol dehydrogenase family)
MIEQQSGTIVNVGSQSTRGLYRLPYAASKGGIVALTKVLAMEYGRYGIRVNTVAPGGTEISDRVTPRQLIRPGVLAEENPETDNYRKEMAEDIRNQQALRRMQASSPGRLSTAAASNHKAPRGADAEANVE